MRTGHNRRPRWTERSPVVRGTGWLAWMIAVGAVVAFVVLLT